MVPPTAPSIDIRTLGNAIVDVLSHVGDGWIDALPVSNGGMAVIDCITAAELYSALGPGVKCSRGSVANTMEGAATLGARAAFIGRTKDDHWAAFETPPS